MTAPINQAMLRKIETGEALDLSKAERLPNGAYVLDVFTEGKDYCDLAEGVWIWSIGRRNADGVILAAPDTRFYENVHFECLWLR